jgi:subtilase family serine protease
VNRSLAGALITSALFLAGCNGGGMTQTAIPVANNVEPASSAPVQTEFQQRLALGYYQPSCGAAAPGEARCFAYVLTPIGQQALGHTLSPEGRRSTQATSTSGPWEPSDLQSAYGTTGAAASNGAGKTVAIVDAYNDPKLAADLATYRSEFGLPACTTASGCLRIVNQTGGTSLPSNNASWSQEISLDVDMVSANCPKCNILVVEVNSPTTANLAAGVNEAAKLGAVAISNSYGASESSSDPSGILAYTHPGIAITVSNGDAGYGVEVPAAYGTVTAVGGTTLTTASNARGWTESVWSGTGSGCSRYEIKPTWQHDTGCTRRTVGDVAYVGNPDTGVYVYDSYAYEGESGWLEFGGTSVGAPSIAAIYALSGNTTGTPASLAYSHTSSLNDVTTGSNGSCSPAYLCHGETGYDGPTGNGTPEGTAAF